MKILTLGKLLLTLIFLFAAQQPALAKTYNVTSGKPKALTVISQYDAESCGAMGRPKYKIKQTQHGKLQVLRHKIKLPNGPCAGRKIEFYFLVYTSKRGFRGKDTGSISYSNSQFTDSNIPSSRRLNIVINVK